jgi:hypothetical protein
LKTLALRKGSAILGKKKMIGFFSSKCGVISQRLIVFNGQSSQSDDEERQSESSSLSTNGVAVLSNFFN